ncbi:MAG: hypothetical protein ACPL7O_08430, partial [Armatimonadota bacterium]
MLTRKGIIIWATLLLSMVMTCSASMIHLRYSRFDPSIGEPSIPEHLRALPVPDERDYYILQFAGPIVPSWKEEVSKLGAELLDYVPDFSFIARMTPEVAKSLDL